MKHKYFEILLRSMAIISISSCCTQSHNEYADSHITVNDEVEWRESKRLPGKFNIPKLVHGRPDFGAFHTMKNCVDSYRKDRNPSAIRGVFLMAYVAASIPYRSGDALVECEDELDRLRYDLGDKNFALCLSTMRPEIQSAVFYLLFYTHWPSRGEDKDWDTKFRTNWPKTYNLEKSVVRLKWASGT